MKLTSLLLLILGSLASSAGVLAQSLELPKLVGTWEWTLAENQCTEVYSFAADGRLEVISGAEITEHLYLVVERSSNERRYRIDVATLRDNAKLDCANKATDDTGSGFTVWIEFSPAGDRLLMCGAPEGLGCFGPFSRKQDI